MKYRKHDWLNTNTMEPEYGIQAKNPKTNEWLHCCEGKNPLVYATEEARNAKLRDLKCDEKNKEATKGCLSNGFNLSPDLTQKQRNEILDGTWP